MTMVAAANTLNPYAVLNTGSSAAAKTQNEAGSEDRFLKLLVTQMQNQDPMNPMDNAQITSQMAQINTVSGVEKLNTTVKGLNSQFNQLQALTGAALVGRQVTLSGKALNVDNGASSAEFELSGAATDVKVEVLNAAGKVVDNVRMGPLNAGRHEFAWKGETQVAGLPYNYRVVAVRGTAAVPATSYMHDRVDAVNTSGASLELETRHSGLVAYGDVKAIH